MYQSQLAREEIESEFEGTSEQFLASLGMTFTIAPARREDLQRAEELTIRTNQLNATGRTYSYDELDALRESPDHLLLVASLTDRFGSYGKIGVALVEKGAAGLAAEHDADVLPGDVPRGRLGAAQPHHGPGPRRPAPACWPTSWRPAATG